MVRDVEPQQIEGRRAVLESLAGGRSVQKILISRGTRGVEEIRQRASAAGIVVQDVPPETIARRAQTTSPQGVIALVGDFEYASLSDILQSAEASPDPALVVAADGLTDPRNLGALARSSEAAGAHGLLIPERRSASVTAVVEKSAAGALAHLPVAQVGNLHTALQTLRERGLWIVALDATGPTPIWELPVADQALCVVVGGEGSGVSRLARDRADVVAAIPLRGRVGSLNAAVAGGIALFEIRRRRDSDKGR